jgi:hypothetical protein
MFIVASLAEGTMAANGIALATEDGFENSASGILDSTVRLHLAKEVSR